MSVYKELYTVTQAASTQGHKNLMASPSSCNAYCSPSLSPGQKHIPKGNFDILPFLKPFLSPLCCWGAAQHRKG